MYEFNLGPVEFETLLGYAGSDVLQEAVNIGIELEEVTELRDTGLADEGMDIDEANEECSQNCQDANSLFHECGV